MFARFSLFQTVTNFIHRHMFTAASDKWTIINSKSIETVGSSSLMRGKRQFFSDRK